MSHRCVITSTTTERYFRIERESYSVLIARQTYPYASPVDNTDDNRIVRASVNCKQHVTNDIGD
jgi:hypothetical protein